MFGIELTDYDKKIYQEELADFLPDKIIDAHTHVWLPGMKRSKPKGSAAWTAKVAPDMTYEDLVQTQTDLYPGKSVTSVIMGSPTCFLDKVNAFANGKVVISAVNALTRIKCAQSEIFKGYVA